jgi:RNA polymerase sigma-70 factor (ECF subfamily)
MPPRPEQEVARLYDAFGASLYRYALMILASREAAEDVLQQVFTALLDRGTQGIRDEERYLKRAVRNTCYSALRAQRVRAATASTDTMLEDVAARGPAVSAEDRVALGAAIRQLPPDQREVLHLHVFEGRTFREVADAIDEPLNTVASRYRYAIEKLKTSLSRPKP